MATIKTQIDVTEPWKGFYKQYAQFLGAGIEGYEPYTGSFAAAEIEEERQALELARANVPSVLGAAEAGQRLGEEMLRPEFLDITSDPYATGAMEAAIRPIQDQLFEQALPRIVSQSMNRHSYGGIRHGLVKEAVTRGAATVAGDITAKMAESMYNRRQMLQLSAPMYMTEMAQMGPGFVGAIGAAERKLNQIPIANQYAMWNAQNMGPIEAGREASGGFASLPKPVTTAATTNVNAGFDWMGLMSGLLGGAAIGASIYNTSQGNPVYQPDPTPPAPTSPGGSSGSWWTSGGGGGGGGWGDWGNWGSGE